MNVVDLAALVEGAADRLRLELEQQGIRADVHEGHGRALLSVWRDLVIWVEPGPEGLRFRWWTGRISDRTGRYVYTGCPAHAFQAAARRIAARYAELRRTHPVPGEIAETLSLPASDRPGAGR